MRVKCLRILDEESGEIIKSSTWLSLGRSYLVLSVYKQDSGPLKFQLIGDDGITPAYHNANQFEVVSDYIPSSWCISSVPGSHFELSPRPWGGIGFGKTTLRRK